VATGPNVVYIVLDTTRADYFSSYGYDLPTTPHIDQLAAEGARFANAFSTDFWTLPSHATLLTGLYPSEAGATGATVRLPEDVRTLSERLRDAGYVTGAIVCNPWLARPRGFAQGFSDYSEMWREEFHRGADDEHSAPAATLGAQWIAQKAAAGQPFFLFMNLNVPHLPYTPPKSLERKFSRRMWSRADVERLRGFHDEIAHFAGDISLSDEDYLILRDLYAAEIAQVDGWVGIVADALRRAGVVDETLLIVTSDHGENIGEYGRTGHMMSLHDTTLHVPLIMRYPQRFSPGTVVRELVSSIHLAPSILEMCGVNCADDERLAARAGLGTAGWRAPQFVFAENDPMTEDLSRLGGEKTVRDLSAHIQARRMYRTERHKLIWTASGHVELYDLLVDPGELVNEASARPELRDQLVAALQRAQEAIEPHVPAAGEVAADDESLEALRALGYIK